MAIGSFLGKVGGTLIGGDAGNWLNLLGEGYDVYNAESNAKQADADRRAMIAQNQQQLDYMMATDQISRAEYNALRDRLLTESTNLATALGQAYNYLGKPYAVDPQRVQMDYMTIRDQNFGDIRDAMELASSRAFANNIAKGMGDSTLNDDDQRKVIATFMPEFNKADQQAYDMALNRATSMQSAIQAGRNNLLNEVNTVAGAQFNAEKGLLGNPVGSSAQQSVAQGYNNLLTDATNVSNAANKYAGYTTGSLDERLTSILEQMAKTTGTKKE